MKKLLKIEIYGSMNSIQMHCLPWKSQQMRAKKKKGETQKKQNAKRGRDKLDPNHT